MVPRWVINQFPAKSLFVVLITNFASSYNQLKLNPCYLMIFLHVCCLQVDLVTMLEKAISYVKFLQLQVKVRTQIRE